MWQLKHTEIKNWELKVRELKIWELKKIHKLLCNIIEDVSLGIPPPFSEPPVDLTDFSNGKILLLLGATTFANMGKRSCSFESAEPPTPFPERLVAAPPVPLQLT